MKIQKRKETQEENDERMQSSKLTAVPGPISNTWSGLREDPRTYFSPHTQLHTGWLLHHHYPSASAMTLFAG